MSAPASSMHHTVEIPLSRGMVALVDQRDAERVLSSGPWHACPSPNSPDTHYATHGVGYGRKGRRSESMHNFITGWPYVDHIDGDGLNNRRSNLRPATHAENMRNQRKRSNNTSGFKGVSRKRDKWRARITLNYREINLGVHPTPEAAARAYDAAARELFGAFARTNFTEASR